MQYSRYCKYCIAGLRAVYVAIARKKDTCYEKQAKVKADKQPRRGRRCMDLPWKLKGPLLYNDQPCRTYRSMCKLRLCRKNLFREDKKYCPLATFRVLLQLRSSAFKALCIVVLKETCLRVFSWPVAWEAVFPFFHTSKRCRCRNTNLLYSLKTCGICGQDH